MVTNFTFSLHKRQQRTEIVSETVRIAHKKLSKTGMLQENSFYYSLHSGDIYNLEGNPEEKVKFRRGQREMVGILIGISIPVLLVLFALLAIITNHFR